MDAYENVRTLHDRTKFRAWLFGILRHKCLNALQRRAPEHLSIDALEESLPAPAPAIGAELGELLDSLALEYREILAARYIQELSYQEIAEVLGSECQRGARALLPGARTPARTLRRSPG